MKASIKRRFERLKAVKRPAAWSLCDVCAQIQQAYGDGVRDCATCDKRTSWSDVKQEIDKAYSEKGEKYDRQGF